MKLLLSLVTAWESCPELRTINKFVICLLFRIDSSCNVVELVCASFGNCCTLLQTFSEVTSGSFTPVKLPVGCYSSSATQKDAQLFAKVEKLQILLYSFSSAGRGSAKLIM